MRKYVSLFILAALVGATPAVAATNHGARAASSVDLTGLPGVRARDNVNYNKYETRTTTSTYSANDGRNIYYTQPAKRSDLYKQYDNTNASRTVRKTRSETYRTTAKRKYFLSHPFFQPLAGKFGSITDLSYNSNSFDLSFTSAALTLTDTAATWSTKEFAVKEDFSFGITDRVAIVGMLKYNSSDYKLDWSASIDDTMDDKGLNLYGVGAQWRFVDNEKWIATASAYFQHQKDTANNFILDIKGGYKVGHTTIYGLGRAWYVDIDGNSYGYGIIGKNAEGGESAIFVASDVNTDSVFYIEGGIGAFSVLDEDWTLNLEATFGDYDWHNQLAVRGAFGWQPNDWFALNIYGKVALHDSADGDTLPWYAIGYEDDVTPGLYHYEWTEGGSAKLDSYTETSFGMQAIFMF